MNTLLETILREDKTKGLYKTDVDDYTGDELETDYRYILSDELDNESPSITSTCGGQQVRKALYEATNYASLASQRLNYISSLPEKQQREKWNKGPENTWFGKYRKNRLINVRNRMWKILQTLKDPLLVISCDWSFPKFGKASPRILNIKLGCLWRDTPRSKVDRVQTLIHEAAHIRGAVLGGELRQKYGIKNALDRANRYPGIAIRTPENIGYYAVCRASNYSGCP